LITPARVHTLHVSRNEMTEIRIERTNFDGSWDEVCPHCGKEQVEHRSIVGELDGVRYEHRLPCAPEKEKIQREHRRVVQTGKIIVFVGWILVPFVVMLLQQFISIFGWLAFALGIFKLGIETIKHFGNPDKWIPGHKAKMEKERKEKHWIYHCEQNPDGFERLKLENLKNEEC